MPIYREKNKRDSFQDLMTILGIGAQVYGAWNQNKQFQQTRGDEATAAIRAQDQRSSELLQARTDRATERRQDAWLDLDEYKRNDVVPQSSELPSETHGFGPPPEPTVNRRQTYRGARDLGQVHPGSLIASGTISRPTAQDLQQRKDDAAWDMFQREQDYLRENPMPLNELDEAKASLFRNQAIAAGRDPLELYRGQREIDIENPTLAEQAVLAKTLGGGGDELTSVRAKWAEIRTRATYPFFNLSPEDVRMLPEGEQPTRETSEAAGQMYDGLIFGSQEVEGEMEGNEIEGLAYEIFMGDPEALVARAGMTDFEGFLVDKGVAELRRQAMSTGMNEWHDVIGGGGAAGAMVTGAYDMGHDQLTYLEGRMRSGVATPEERAEFERLTAQAREVEQLQEQRRWQRLWGNMPTIGGG